MDTSNIEEIRELSDGPTIILMFILISAFVIAMLCTDEKKKN